MKSWNQLRQKEIIAQYGKKILSMSKTDVINTMSTRLYVKYGWVSLQPEYK